MLVNLISNAVRYSFDNGTVTVGLKREGANVVGTVMDQGTGIPADSLPPYLGALLPGRQFQDRRKPFRAWAFHGEVDRGGARGECVSDEPARGRKHIYIPAPGGEKEKKIEKIRIY